MKKIGVIVALLGLALIKSEIVGLVILTLVSIAGLLFLLNEFAERGY